VALIGPIDDEVLGELLEDSCGTRGNDTRHPDNGGGADGKKKTTEKTEGEQPRQALEKAREAILRSALGRVVPQIPGSSVSRHVSTPLLLVVDVVSRAIASAAENSAALSRAAAMGSITRAVATRSTS